jgi:hypothetical protein
MYIRMLLIRSHLSGLDLAGMRLSWQLKCTSIERPFIVLGRQLCAPSRFA